jgi:hypothetical protein
METSELRIGNLLTNYGNLCKVVSIQKDNFQVEVIKIENIIQVDFSKPETVSSLIKPIPLTEEWLKKFGFKKDMSVYKNDWIELWHSSYSNCYQLRIIKVGDDISKKINIQYVHQLQNLYFILTEKELKL